MQAVGVNSQLWCSPFSWVHRIYCGLGDASLIQCTALSVPLKWNQDQRPVESVKWWGPALARLRDLYEVWFSCRSHSCPHRDIHLAVEKWSVLKSRETSQILPSSVWARTQSSSVSCFLKCVFSSEAVESLALSPRMTCKEELSPLQETRCFWSMVPYIFSPAEWYSSWLIREVPSCIHLLGAAVPGLSHSRTKVPRKWVVLSSPESWAPSLAVANHLGYFGIRFPLTPVTVDSVNTHVKYYLGIFKCLTAVAFSYFVRGTRICIILFFFFLSFFPPPFCREGCGWRARWGFFCHLSQHQGIRR